MQPIPVKRVNIDSNASVDAIASGPPPHTQNIVTADMTYTPPRYALATSLDDADEDGKLTRFICRFHTITAKEEGDQTKLEQVILGETLSYYPYNPEHANFLKSGSKPMLTPLEKGHDEQIWNSVYSIRCPTPNVGDGIRDLATILTSGESITEPDGVPSIYVDLIPIRTLVRRNKEGFHLPGVTTTSDGSPMFDPMLVWGEGHLLPDVYASGRWINIPVCGSRPFEKRLAPEANQMTESVLTPTELDDTRYFANKTHFLVGCVWASRSFSTRGQTTLTDSSTSERLLEFLAYHLKIAGFDHIYVYDNSDTSIEDNLNATLAPVTDLFSRKLVSRIPWPHRICNNNRPAHSNPGERSSQYAAEASCRARYGPDTEWLISLDVDEYLIPVSKQWKDIKEWLRHVNAAEKDTKILSFYQTRALPNIDVMVPYSGPSTKSCTGSGANTEVQNAMCAMKVWNNEYGIKYKQFLKQQTTIWLHSY
jgi:hypothetical protein